MRLVKPLLGVLFVSAALHAGVITVPINSINLSISDLDQDEVDSSGATSLITGKGFGTGDWSISASLLTNLVDNGNGFATANDSLQFRLTNVTMTCIAETTCGAEGIMFSIGFITEPISFKVPYSVSLTGSGPDVEFGEFGTMPGFDVPVSGPNYAFSQSGPAVEFGNTSMDFGLFLLNSYDPGTTLSLPDSADITLGTAGPVPEPTTLVLLGAGIGLAALRFRRRSAGTR